MSEVVEKSPMSPAERMAVARAAKAAKAKPGFGDDAGFTEADIPEGHVKVRILKLGDKRIATGELVEFGHTPEERFPCYQRNEHAYLPVEYANAYEDKGWVELVG